MPKSPSEQDGLLIGLSGHCLALKINEGQLPAAFDPEDKIRRTRDLISIVTNREDPLRSCYFAREGLAHALGVLALDPRLEEEQREAALAIAKDALARTGSAEEAAAWAVAITNLLQGREIVEFVESIVDVLKYPTTALTAREPNAVEPRNATDIFLQALAERKDLETLMKPQNKTSDRGCRMKMLDEIIRDNRFAHINLAASPADPRLKRQEDDNLDE